MIKQLSVDTKGPLIVFGAKQIRREEKTTGFQFSTICRQLKLTAADGKIYLTDKRNLPPKKGIHG